MAVNSSATFLGSPVLYLPDTLGPIFSFLSLTDFNKTSLVCKTWELVANNCWKNLLAYKSTKDRFVENFSSYVADESMTWKEAYRYANLSLLFTKILAKNFSQGSYAAAENPALQNEQFPSVRIPQPWVCFGNTILSIFNSCDVKIQKKGEVEFKIFKGEDGKMLTHLAVENEFLFALRNDGYIVQYHLTTGEQNKIPTSWVLGQNNIQDRAFKVSGPFHVEGGYMIFKHLLGGLEILPYGHVKKGQVVVNHDLPFPHHILVVQEKLYILGRNEVFIWDLSKNERVTNLPIPMSPSHFAYDIALAHNRFFVTENKAFHIIHPETAMSVKNASKNLYEIVVVGNLLFGSTNTSIPVEGTNNRFQSLTGIVVIDLNTGITLEHVKMSSNPHLMPLNQRF
jgi:hypothetical protein